MNFDSHPAEDRPLHYVTARKTRVMGVNLPKLRLSRQPSAKVLLNATFGGSFEACTFQVIFFKSRSRRRVIDLARYLMVHRQTVIRTVPEVNMGFWREKFEAMAMAVAFAEAGEWDTARSLVKDTGAPRVGRTAKTRKRTENRPKKRLFRL